MSESVRRAAGVLEAAAAAVGIAVTVIGLTVMLLLTPQFVRWRVDAGESAGLTGLGRNATLQAAEAVRRFVVDEDAPALPAEIDGTAAFDEAAVSHLVDVREVVIGARWMAVMLGIACAAWALARVRTRSGRALVRSAVRSAAWLLVLGLAAGTLVGATSFDALFTWFHGLFFAAGTWTFPEDALLIRIFPLRFWMEAAASWMVLVLTSAVGLFIAERRLRFTEGT